MTAAAPRDAAPAGMTPEHAAAIAEARRRSLRGLPPVILRAMAEQDAARTARVLRANGAAAKIVWHALTGETRLHVAWAWIEKRIAHAVLAELIREATPPTRRRRPAVTDESMRLAA